MAQSGSSQTEARPGGSALYGAYVAALAVSLFGNLFIRIGAEAGFLSAWGQAVVGAAAAIPLMVAAVMFWRLLRRDLVGREAPLQPSLCLSQNVALVHLRCAAERWQIRGQASEIQRLAKSEL